MQESLDGFLIVKEFDNESTFKIPKHSIGQSKIAKVVSSTKKSVYSRNDIVVHEEHIAYYPATDLGNDYYYVRERDITGIVREGGIFATKDLVFFSVNEHSKHFVELSDGKKFQIDHTYNPYRKDLVTPFGEVISVPLVATDSYSYDERQIPIDIKVGDIVYALHFLVGDTNKVHVGDKVHYTQRYEECYCRVRNGKVKMINNFNFIKPIKDEKETLKVGNFVFKKESENDSNKGIVKYICEELKEQGVEIGDTIVFKKDADYPVDFCGEELYRINNLEILAKLNKDNMKLEALDNKVIVKQFTPKTETEQGFIIPQGSRFTPNKGVVISKGIKVNEIEIGDTVYFEGQFGLMIPDGEELYRVLEEKHCFSRDKK